jgi:hypothetical protein
MRRLLPYRRRPHPLKQVIRDPQRVGDRDERRVDRADAREDARVDDVQVVELVGAPIRVEDRGRRISAEPDCARLMCDAGNRDVVFR